MTIPARRAFSSRHDDLPVAMPKRIGGSADTSARLPLRLVRGQGDAGVHSYFDGAPVTFLSSDMGGSDFVVIDAESAIDKPDWIRTDAQALKYAAFWPVADLTITPHVEAWRSPAADTRETSSGFKPGLLPCSYIVASDLLNGLGRDVREKRAHQAILELILACQEDDELYELDGLQQALHDYLVDPTAPHRRAVLAAISDAEFEITSPVLLEAVSYLLESESLARLAAMTLASGGTLSQRWLEKRLESSPELRSAVEGVLGLLRSAIES